MSEQKIDLTPETPETPAMDDVRGAVAVLPLRDVVVYPHMVIPLFVGRDRSILALDKAMEDGKQVLLVSQKEADIDEPTADDLYEFGTLSTILQLLKLPDGTVKVLVEGRSRARITDMERRNNDLLKQMDAVKADAAEGLAQAENLAELTRMQDEAQKAIEKLKAENETLRAAQGIKPGSKASTQMESELRSTLEEVAHFIK